MKHESIKVFFVDAMKVIVLLAIILGVVYVSGLLSLPYSYQNQFGALLIIAKTLVTIILAVTAVELILHGKMSGTEKFMNVLRSIKYALPLALLVYVFNIFTLLGSSSFLLFLTILYISDSPKSMRRIITRMRVPVKNVIEKEDKA